MSVTRMRVTDIFAGGHCAEKGCERGPHFTPTLSAPRGGEGGTRVAGG
jgi:hypothetical protein